MDGGKPLLQQETLGLTIFAAIYALFPMLTGKQLSERLADVQLILWTVGGLVMGLSMGLAEVAGMLRRMLYVNGLGSFRPYMNAALVGTIILASGYAVFIANIIITVGFKTILGLFYAHHKLSMTVQAVIEAG
jgi:heme/copper-type cytochrome/quinol oxidase subunit 1